MDFIDIVRYFGALALVLALVGAAALFVRRYGLPGVVGGKGRRIAIVESVMLGKNHRLMLVKCDGLEHLLAVGPQSTTVVGSQTAALAPAQATAAIAHATEDFAA